MLSIRETLILISLLAGTPLNWLVSSVLKGFMGLQYSRDQLLVDLLNLVGHQKEGRQDQFLGFFYTLAPFQVLEMYRSPFENGISQCVDFP